MRRILQIIPGTNWSASIADPNVLEKYPDLVCWALVEDDDVSSGPFLLGMVCRGQNVLFAGDLPGFTHYFYTG